MLVAQSRQMDNYGQTGRKFYCLIDTFVHSCYTALRISLHRANLCKFLRTWNETP